MYDFFFGGEGGKNAKYFLPMMVPIIKHVRGKILTDWHIDLLELNAAT